MGLFVYYKENIMARIQLGKTPKSFKRVINIDMLDGTKGSIECEFKYRTRTEFGKFLDGIFESAGVKPVDPDEKVVIAEVMEKTRDTNADYLIQVLEGWNLDDDLTKANLQQLCDEFPGAANSIMEAYRLAVTEGRAKN
jgi:Phage tail assembly chaperone